jgi:hypothetical protein
MRWGGGVERGPVWCRDRGFLVSGWEGLIGEFFFAWRHVCDRVGCSLCNEVEV